MQEYLRGQRTRAVWGQNPVGLEPVVPDMPRLLYLGHQLREWHTLLVPGGLLDQPYRLWTYVQTALVAEDNWYALQARLKPVEE